LLGKKCIWKQQLTDLDKSDIGELKCTFGGVLGTTNWDKASRSARTCWRDYVSRFSWERLGVTQDEQEEVAGDRDVWASLLSI